MLSKYFPVELAAGTVTIVNAGKKAAPLGIYVPNRDTVFVSMPAGKTLKVETQSAGETFMYMSQASDKLTVSFAKAAEAAAVDPSTEG